MDSMDDTRLGAGVAWRQSLGAGLLLGLALGCAWLAHWAPQLYTRILLIAAAALLTLLGAGLMLSLSESRGWMAAWQRQVELRLAAAGLPFFAALVILGLAAVTSGNNLLYLILSGLLAVLIISGLTSALNLSGMVLRFRLPPEVFAGEPVPVAFTLTNAKGFWPAYSLTVSAASRSEAGGSGERPEASLRPVYVAYLRRRDSVSAASEIVYPRRGRYATTAFMLTTRFPFGLIKKRRRFQADEREPEMLVYPAPLAPPRFNPARLRAGAGAPRNVRGEGQDLYRIRPHQPGDSARQVHWKASARAGALRVREFGDEDAARARLRLALPRGLAPARAEAALSLCAGWLLAFDQLELWLEFVGENAPGLFLALAPAAQHRRAILDYLAVADPAAPGVSSPELEPGLFEILVDGAAEAPPQ